MQTNTGTRRHGLLLRGKALRHQGRLLAVHGDRCALWLLLGGAAHDREEPCEAVLFGAGHDMAGLRALAIRGTWVSRPHGGLLLLSGRKELVQVGVDVFLNLVEVLPLGG